MLVYTHAGSLHRLGNSSTQTGHILEIAFGDLDEADVERLHNDYTRPGVD